MTFPGEFLSSLKNPMLKKPPSLNIFRLHSIYNAFPLLASSLQPADDAKLPTDFHEEMLCSDFHSTVYANIED
jgi:hypothetical protein